ncbi:hypothetical protein [Mycobacterium sp. HUMS_1102779]|uniref:hypothetical protein n=1 Tax=Mycobacterium sp. HUMS_1102779 TaxID=3383487 RepID=UPI00389B38A9
MARNYARRGGPAWYDELTAIPRSHGVHPGPSKLGREIRPGAGRALPATAGFGALATVGGRPLVRRTWVVWPAPSRRQDLAHLVGALEDVARDPGAAGLEDPAELLGVF